jgi:heme-degrading monooxygenase HmoA
MLFRIVRMTFRPGETEAFQAIFRQSQPLIRAFPGCQHVELLRDIDDPCVFSTLSRWDNAEALENYRQSDLFRRTWAQTKVLFADRPQAFSMERV